ncbi:hypothetical protein CEXT_744311 [Caerostris extrusa]|uniref:Uncharacterized protein n=1 Tax=Caerostris extrusa TaxID=172846 RepID=A0AAV4Y7T1_CAEEX|nr:hypothetical protein CEXT_744311 [Caerostris extrusa]
MLQPLSTYERNPKYIITLYASKNAISVLHSFNDGDHDGDDVHDDGRGAHGDHGDGRDAHGDDGHDDDHGGDHDVRDDRGDGHDDHGDHGDRDDDVLHLLSPEMAFLRHSAKQQPKRSNE